MRVAELARLAVGSGALLARRPVGASAQDRQVVGLELAALLDGRRVRAPVGLEARVAAERRLDLTRKADEVERRRQPGRELGRAAGERGASDALHEAELVLLGDVLGEEGEPVVPVV